jgi:hypothetical protein
VSDDSKVPGAREAAEAISRDLRAWYRASGGRGAWFELTDRIVEAIERDRAATIEACARVVEEHPVNHGTSIDAVSVAARIRALGTRSPR